MSLYGLKADAQNTPLISGGVGFLTSTNGGVTNYQPVISPVAAVPLGEHLLVESRAYISSNYAPKNGTGPYQGNFFAGLQYLQLDYIAAPRLTLTVGDFFNAIWHLQRASNSHLDQQFSGCSPDLPYRNPTRIERRRNA